MLSIDDLLKIILILSISFAIVGIAFEIMKLISKVIQMLEDLRRPINNVSELTDYALEDYVDARSLVREGISDLSSIKNVLANPMLIGGFILKIIKRIKNSKKEKEQR